jgi:small subunit ribosomal protein S16
VAVKIRLMRVGKTKQPTYRVVVADGRSPRDGRFIEIVGQYAPRSEPSHIQIDDEAVLGWLRKGAQPTESVQKLLAITGVWGRYEAERGKPVRTKLASRAYHGDPPSKVVKPGKGADEAPAPAAEAAPVEVADESPAVEAATPAVEAATPAVEAPETESAAADAGSVDAEEASE